MKIKRTRQVRLDELIKYIFENDIRSCNFESDNDSWVRIDTCGDIVDVYSIEKSDLFTISEEVEITEDTILDNIVCIFGNNKGGVLFKTSISRLIEQSKAYNLGVKYIYPQNPDGSIGELIWSKERGLVE